MKKKMNRQALLAAMTAVGCFSAMDAWASTVSWQGSSGVQAWSATANWSSSANWVANDSASFYNTSGNTSINLNAARTIAGLYFDGTSGQFDIGNGNASFALTLNNVTTISNFSSFTQTISAPVTLGNATALVGTQGINFTGAVSQGNGARTITNNLSSAGLTLGTVALSSNATVRNFTMNGSGSSVITGAITNGTGGATSGSLTYSGTGTLELKGANSYTGTTTLSGNGGTLKLNGGTLGSTSAGLIISNSAVLDLGGSTQTIGTVSITSASTASNGTLIATGGYSIANGGTVAASINLAGTGGLNKSNTGTLVLSGNNTYSGDTTVGNGTLTLNSANALNNSGNIVFTGGTLQFSSGNSTDYSARIKNSTGAISLDTNGLTSMSVGAIENTNAGGLTKLGAGTLILTGANAYGGLTTVTAGTLQIGPAGSLPSDRNVTVSGTLDLNGHSISVNNLNATGVITSSTSGAVTITVGSGGDGTGSASNIQDGSGTVAVTKVGTGTLTLSGNTFTGGLTVKSGTVSGGLGAFGSSSGMIYLGDTTGTASATLITTLNTQTLANPTISVQAGSTLNTLTIQGTLNGTVAGGIALNNNLTVDNSAATKSTTFSGNITEGSGALTITKAAGAGSVTLAGGIVVGSGGLTLANLGATSFNASGTISGTGNLTLNSGSGTASGIQLSGTASNAGGITNSGTGSGATTINGVIGSAVTSLTQNSSTSKLILTGGSNTTFTGPVNVTSGTLTFGQANKLSSSSLVTLGNAGTLDLLGYGQVVAGLADGNAGVGEIVTDTSTGGASKLTEGGSGTNSYAGTISGNMGLTVAMTGSGRQTLSGPTSYTGGTTINSGALYLTGSATLGLTTAPLTIGGGTLDLGSSSQTVGALALNSSTGATIQGGTLTASSLTATNATSTISINSALAGSGALTKTTGAGTLSLGGSNTGYSGAIRFGAGELDITNANALGTGALTLSGGTLANLTASSVSPGNSSFTWSGNFTTSGSDINFGSNQVTLGAASTVSASNNLAVGGKITGNFALTKAGVGTLTVSSASNDYSGGTTVSGGKLQISGTGTLGASTAPLTIGSATLDLGSTSQNVGIVTISGAGTVSAGSLSASTYTANLASGTAVVSANLGGAATPLTKSGAASTLILQGNNSYGGLTTVSGGILQVDGTNTSAGLTQISGGTLALGTNTNGGLASGLITMGAGTIQSEDNNPRSISNNITFTGTPVVFGAAQGQTGGIGDLVFSNVGSAAVVNSQIFTVNNSTTVTLSNGTFGPSNYFTKNGSGVLVLNNITLGFGTNPTTLSAGTLKFSGSTTFGLSGNLVVNGGIVDLNGTNQQPRAFSGTGGTILNNAGSGTSLLTLGNGNTNSGAYSGTIIDHSSGSAIVALAVNNGGTVTLANANSYTGGTNLIAGNLNFANGALGSGPITFSGGVLQYATSNTQDISTNTLNTSSTASAAKIDVNGNTVVFNNAIGSGITGGLTLTTSATGGSLTLAAGNAYTGLTTVTSGTLKLGASSSIPSGGAVTVLGTLDLNGNDANISGFFDNTPTGTVTNTSTGAAKTLTMSNPRGTSGTGPFTGNMNIIWNMPSSASTTYLSNSLSNSGDITFNNASNSSQGTNASINVNNAGNIFYNTTAGQTGTTNGVVQLGNIGANVRSITANGTRLNLIGSNAAFTGSMYLLAGTLEFGSAASWGGNGTVINIQPGTTLKTAGVTLSNSIAQNWYGDFTLVQGGPSNYGAGPVTLYHDTSLLISNSGSGTFITSSPIGGTGNFAVSMAIANTPTFKGLINNAGTFTYASANGNNFNADGGFGSNVTNIINNTNQNITASGGITVNSGGTTLTASSTGGIVNVTGSIVGTGDLILRDNVTQSGTAIQLSTVDNIGRVSNAGTGTSPVLFTNGLGSNVTSLVQNSTSSQIKMNNGGPIAVNAAGTSIVNNSGGSSINLVTGTTGTGNLILQNNNSGNGLTAGILFNSNGAGTSSVNHSGTITNSGTGTGDVQIQIPIGANVTEIIQSSPTSLLSIQASNTASNGKISVSAGTVVFSSTQFTGLTLKNTSTGAGFNVTGATVLGSGGLTIDSASTHAIDLTPGAGSFTTSVSQTWTNQSPYAAKAPSIAAGSGLVTFLGAGGFEFPAASNINASGVSLSIGDASGLNGTTVTMTVGTNKYLGGTTLWAGSTAYLNGNQCLGGIAGTSPAGTFTINGGTIGQNGGTTSIAMTQAPPVLIAGNFSFVGPNNLDLGTGDVTLSGNNTIDVTGGTLTLSGVLASSTAGSYGFTKTGASTLKLANANNTYAGKTVIANGTLSFANGNASATANQSLGTHTDVDLGVAGVSSGTLLYTGAAGTLAKNVNALGNGSNTIQNSGTGPLTLAGVLAKNHTVLNVKGGSQGIIVSGQITGGAFGSNDSDLVIDGGTTTLTNSTNNYYGPTFVQNGATLILGDNNVIPANSDVTITGSTLALGSTVNSVAGLSVTGSSITGTGTLNSTGLSVTGSNSIGGTLNVSGATTVTPGATLDVTGSFIPSGPISGTLTITGTGDISPGGLNAPTTLATGDLAVAGTYIADLSGTSNSDRLNVSGELNLTGGSLQLNDMGITGGAYVIASYTTLTGDFGTNISGLPLGAQVVYGYGPEANEIAVTIPEPSTIAMVLGLSGLLTVGRRRRAAK